MAIEAGTIVDGKYRVEREIGSGGMGTILRAEHVHLHEPVAIKVLQAPLGAEATVVARFLREARAAARITSEHVVRVRDVGTLPSGEPYMVMELLQGEDLSYVVHARGPLPVEEAVGYVLQACEAIAEAHAKGIVHRDLKLANLFLTRRADGSPLVKVLDFGISKVARADGIEPTTTSSLVGSPQYMSPEQLRQTRDVDGRSDIWSLGVVLFKLLTDEYPFAGESVPELVAAALYEEPKPLTGAPPELARVVARCLEKDRAARIPDVGALATALGPFAPREAISVERAVATLRGATRSEIERATTAVDVRTGKRPRRALAAAAIVVVAAGGGAAWIATHRATPSAASAPPTASQLPPAPPTAEASGAPSDSTALVPPPPSSHASGGARRSGRTHAAPSASRTSDTDVPGFGGRK